MIKKIITILLIILFLSLLFGCVPPEERSEEETEVSEDLSNLDALEEDFNLKELENLEKELDIDW